MRSMTPPPHPGIAMSGRDSTADLLVRNCYSATRYHGTDVRRHARRILGAATEVFAEQRPWRHARRDRWACRNRRGERVPPLPNKDELIMTLFDDRFANWSGRPPSRPTPRTSRAAFVRYFEEAADALVRDHGLPRARRSAPTPPPQAGPAAPPDPLYALFARTEAAMREHHIRLVQRAQEAECSGTTSTRPTCGPDHGHRGHRGPGARRSRPDIHRRVSVSVLDGLRPAARQPDAAAGPAADRR